LSPCLSQPSKYGPEGAMVTGAISAVDNDLGEVTITHELGETNMSIDEVALVREVKCSRRHVDSANLHALKRFLGARVLHVRQSRCSRISETTAKFVAEFLQNTENVEVAEASIANSKSGGKYKIKMARCSMWGKLRLEILEAGLVPVSYGHFFKITKDYGIVSADNCFCGSCRDLGMYNFNELRDVIKELNEYLKELSSATIATCK
jgi:hypothetical protein